MHSSIAIVNDVILSSYRIVGYQGRDSKVCLKSEIKILYVNFFVIKLRQNGIHKNFVLDIQVMDKVLNMAAMSCFRHFKTSHG